jgi:precorrin-6Y C5,15-methyltransferase (decarboxylating)
MGEPRLAVVGLHGGVTYGPAARAAIEGAEVVVGSPRQLDATKPPTAAEQVPLQGPLPSVLDTIEERRRAGRRVCVLASGDPGFFGIVRALGERFGPAALDVHPAPSSVALAFARAGLPWDDALVVSAHGRPLADAVREAMDAPKVAVLTSPDNPPHVVGRALLDAGCGPRDVAVASHVGEAGESIVRTDLEGLAGGDFDAMSVLVLLEPSRPPSAVQLTWGLPETAFRHRGGMITKAEVRAVALGKLALPPSGVLWDVGAGSGSVGIECARLCPSLAVFAVERGAEDAERIRENAAAHGVAVSIVEGAAPDALAGLPDPDRVFIGGGGLDVLDAALARLRAGGAVVATYAVLDRAVQAWGRLGNLVEVSIGRGVGVGELGVRLAAENPVFVCWGPEPQA